MWCDAGALSPMSRSLRTFLLVEHFYFEIFWMQDRRFSTVFREKFVLRIVFKLPEIGDMSLLVSFGDF